MSESVALMDGWADWRGADDDEDPDDEELAKTPPDVIRVLGFDPLKEATADAESESRTAINTKMHELSEKLNEHSK